MSVKSREADERLRPFTIGHHWTAGSVRVVDTIDTMLIQFRVDCNRFSSTCSRSSQVPHPTSKLGNLTTKDFTHSVKFHKTTKLEIGVG